MIRLRPPRALAWLLVPFVFLPLSVVLAFNRTDAVSIHTVSLGRWPDALALDTATHRAFVSNEQNATLSVLDLRNSSVVGSVGVGNPTALVPRALAIDVRTHNLFVTDPLDGLLPSVIRVLD